MSYPYPPFVEAPGYSTFSSQTVQGSPNYSSDRGFSSSSTLYPSLTASPSPSPSLTASPSAPFETHFATLFAGTPFTPTYGSMAQYPPNPGSTPPYSINPGSTTPYPVNPYPPTTAPYPFTSGSSSYPPNPHATSPYPPNPHATSPYPPNPHATNPYPPNPPVASPYPPNPATSPYPSNQSAAFPYPNNPGHMAPYPSGSTPGYPAFPQQSYSQPSAPVDSASSAQFMPYPQNPTTFPGAHPYPHSYNPSSATHDYLTNSPMAHGSGSMWPYQERPTLRPAMSFDPSGDASLLRKAMKGFGTDEKAIIQILGRRTCQQRQQIAIKYQQAYGKDLIADLKKELSGRVEDSIMALMTPWANYLANELHKAIGGIGTNEVALVEIMCSNDNRALSEIKAAYNSMFKSTIEKDLSGDTSGYFKRLLISLAAGSRDETNLDTSAAPRLAQELYKAGAKKVGTDEAEFNRILASYSYPVLRSVFSEYVKISGKTFEQAIHSETSGDYRDGLLALYNVINNRAAYFAKELNAAMKGFGTKDNPLIRIVVSRSEIDMGNIKDEYTKLYGKRLEDAISSETSGDYKGLLLALTQG